MSAQVIDGRRYAEELASAVADEVDALAADGLPVGLVTVAVGDDYGSAAYGRRVGRIAAELRVACRHVALPAACTEAELLELVDELNGDRDVTGVLILRPLPDHVSEAVVFGALAPLKDIEAVHPENAGLLALGVPRYVPATAASVFHVLDRWLEDSGEEAADFYHRSLIVVVGRSNNVGKPAVSLAYDREAAVESVDEWASLDGRLGWHTRRAQVLVVAAGVTGLIRSEHVSEDAVILDVGINPVTDAETGRVRMVGDVDFEDVAGRARAVTPVPGGIGPVTDVWLLRNTVKAARNAAAATTEELRA